MSKFNVLFVSLLFLAFIIVFSLLIDIDKVSMHLNNDMVLPYSWITVYVTPDDPLVAQYTVNAVGGMGNYNGRITVDDIYSIQKWVSSNIKYAEEEPKYPNETLKTMTGNCFNKAVLEYSMILNENQDSDTDLCATYILLVDVTTEDNEVIRHSSVLCIFPSGILISDPSIDASYVNSICFVNKPEKAIDEIVERTIVTSYVINTAVSLDSYYLFDSNQDFVDWSYQQMKGCVQNG